MKTTRRKFLSVLAALPIVGGLFKYERSQSSHDTFIPVLMWDGEKLTERGGRVNRKFAPAMSLEGCGLRYEYAGETVDGKALYVGATPEVWREIEAKRASKSDWTIEVKVT